MKKIVLITSQPEPDDVLLTWLSALFPYSEIQIVFKKVENPEQCQADSFSGPFMTDTIGWA